MYRKVIICDIIHQNKCNYQVEPMRYKNQLERLVANIAKIGQNGIAKYGGNGLKL